MDFTIQFLHYINYQEMNISAIQIGNLVVEGLALVIGLFKCTHGRASVC